MTVRFTFGQFLQPAEILKYRHLFNRGQWLSRSELESYQLDRLHRVMCHVYQNVPYYRELFLAHRLTPKDFRTLEDLKKLPTLTKDTLRQKGDRLKAVNAARFHPQRFSTSGSTGASQSFLLDRQTNAQEFAYYWRYWNWAGYHIGDCFGEFSASHFSRDGKASKVSEYQPFTGRLLLNSLGFTESVVHRQTEELKKHGALFLKGLPSVLGGFSQLLHRAQIEPPHLQAIFTTGELLLPPQRAVIEQTFGAKVFDSYGQMERLVAISECPAHRMHVNSDYGLLECENGQALGTSLHNSSMPLLRYELGDIIELDSPAFRCPCGRNFPVVASLKGRQSDCFELDDGRVVPAIFLALRGIEGIAMCQFVIESKRKVRARVVSTSGFTTVEQAKLLTQLRWHVGDTVPLELEHVTFSQLTRCSSGKFKMVVSHE